MRDLEYYYQVFADLMIDSLPESWYKAWIYVEVEEDYNHYSGRYQETEEVSTIKSFLPDDSLEEKAVEFWNVFQEGEQDPWFSFTFTLFPSGKFELNFSYENPDDAEEE